MNDLTRALDAIRGFAMKFIVFPSQHEPIAIALWIVHAHMVERFETSPILGITSAEMRSAKTLVLDVVSLLVPHPERMVTPSEATVFFVLNERPRRTLLLDEADAIFGPKADARRFEGLRGILNSGNRQGTMVPRVRMEGNRRELERFDVYGPKAIAGIGKLPDTVADRSIPIRMKRKAPGESVDRFRMRTAERLAIPIREQLEELDVTLVTDATGAGTEVPEELNDRAADSWETLLLIADAAGEDWPHLGRQAALALSADDETEVSIGIRLLTDIRDVFDARDHLATADLLAGLHDIEEAPWGDWYGKPLSARSLARMLEPYRVRPQHRRVDGGDVRGYFAQDFTDVWARYVPVPTTVTTVTSVTDPDDVTNVTHVTLPWTDAA
jgi:hypothetical protein